MINLGVVDKDISESVIEFLNFVDVMCLEFDLSNQNSQLIELKQQAENTLKQINRDYQYLINQSLKEIIIQYQQLFNYQADMIKEKLIKLNDYTKIQANYLKNQANGSNI